MKEGCSGASSQVEDVPSREPRVPARVGLQLQSSLVVSKRVSSWNAEHPTFGDLEREPGAVDDEDSVGLGQHVVQRDPDMLHVFVDDEAVGAGGKPLKDREPCPCCGDDRRARCGVLWERGTPNEHPCVYPAGWGTDHNGYGRCRFHGGNKQSRNVYKAMLKDLEPVYGSAKEEDPWNFLRQELARTAGHVAWLGMVVADLNGEEDLFEETERGRIPNIYVRMYEAERKAGRDIAKTMIAGGVAERRVELMEQETRMLALILTQVVNRLPLDDATRKLVPHILREELMRADAIEAGVVE